MSRLQLALTVSDIDEAVGFYSTLFAVEPAKRRPGYANFVVADPPLKLVLIEDPVVRERGTIGALNHLGIEVETTDEVTHAAGRLSGEGLSTTTEFATSCCHAVQDKVWVEDPDGAPWEIYTVLAHEPDPGHDPEVAPTARSGTDACCTGTSVASDSPTACC